MNDSKWKSVDNPPERYHYALYIHSDNGIGRVGFYHKGKFLDMHSKTVIIGATHWQPVIFPPSPDGKPYDDGGVLDNLEGGNGDEIQ